MASKMTIRQALGSPTRGDFNCFVNVFFNNSTTVIAVIGALQVVFNIVDPTGSERALQDSIVYGKIFAGMTMTMIFGNVYYAWMAIRLMRQTGRTDVTAMPYGINTPAAFAFVFTIMIPAAVGSLVKGGTPAQSIKHAWTVGCAANLVGGLISTLCGFAGPLLAKVAPRSAMTVALAGIGLTWLGVNQIQENFAASFAGLLPLAVSILVFFGGVKTDPIPTSLVIILVGSLAGWLSMQPWLDGGSRAELGESFGQLGFHMPTFLDADSFGDIGEVLSNYLGIILPVALTGAVGTLLNVHAAREAGDDYPINESMIVDGLTTMVSALFGSPLATCVFIGHPQFKQQDGKVFYAIFSAILFTIFAVLGLFAVVKAFIPPYAMSPIILFVGVAINQDMFAMCQKRHLPAVILGLFPALCDWATTVFQKFPPGINALAKGALFVGLLWAALGIFIIDKRYRDAVAWTVAAAIFSAIGVIHQPSVDLKFQHFFGAGDTFEGTSPCAFFLGYMFVAVLLCVPWCLQMSGSERVGRPDYTEDEMTNGAAVSMKAPLVESHKADPNELEMGASFEERRQAQEGAGPDAFINLSQGHQDERCASGE